MHCDVYYITHLLAQYSDTGTFYYKTHIKAIIIHVCGFYRFYNIKYLEGYSILKFSTYNSTYYICYSYHIDICL